MVSSASKGAPPIIEPVEQLPVGIAGAGEDAHVMLVRVPPALTPAQAAFVVLAATAVYGTLHSLLAGRPAKSWARRALGPAADRGYRLAYNVIGGLTFLPLLAFTAAQPGRLLYNLPVPLRWICLAGQVLALLVIAVGVLQTGALHFLGLQQLAGADEGGATLVVGGLYRYVRHPLYSAGLVFLWLTPVMTTTLLALYLGLSVYLYLGSIFEERRLAREFGAAYQAYQERVPRLVPRPGRTAG
jgi:protein-S-isoprenylcysteine O-methyltransferase Ste14